MLTALVAFAKYHIVFNVFRYITFRTAMALLTALVLSLFLGPWMIRKLRERQIGETIRTDGPERHRAKAGTPTMGGLLIVGRSSSPCCSGATSRTGSCGSCCS